MKRRGRGALARAPFATASAAQIDAPAGVFRHARGTNAIRLAAARAAHCCHEDPGLAGRGAATREAAGAGRGGTVGGGVAGAAARWGRARRARRGGPRARAAGAPWHAAWPALGTVHPATAPLPGARAGPGGLLPRAGLAGAGPPAL